MIDRSARVDGCKMDPATVIFVMAAGLWLIQAAYMVIHVDTWLDEGVYLIKSAYYFSGQVQPYSLDDATSYPPLYFYILGAAQWLFGSGHLTGRLLSVFFALCTLLLLYVAAYRCLQDRLAAGLSVLIYAANPMAVAYMSTATPYALVTFLTLTAFLVVTDTKVLPPLAKGAAMGILAAMLVLIRVNLVIALPMFALLHLYVAWDTPRRAATVLVEALIVTAGLLAISIQIFGRGLFETLIFLPGLTQLLWRFTNLGAEMHEVLTATSSPTDLEFQWPVVQEVINRYFLQLYPALLIAVIPGSVISLILFRRRPLAGFCTVYFIVMTAAHLLGSQSYCPSCLMGYANYFLPFAAVPATMFLMILVDQLWAPVAAISLAVFMAAGIFHVSGKSRLGMLIPDSWSNPMAGEHRLAQSLKPLLPKSTNNDPILVLSAKYLTVQAVWLAGGFIEPYSISLFPYLREPLDTLDPQEKFKARRALQARGFRDADALMEDLRRPKAAVVVQDQPAMGSTLASYLGPKKAEQVENALKDRYLKEGEVSEGADSVSVWLPK